MSKDTLNTKMATESGRPRLVAKIWTGIADRADEYYLGSVTVAVLGATCPAFFGVSWAEVARVFVLVLLAVSIPGVALVTAIAGRLDAAAGTPSLLRRRLRSAVGVAWAGFTFTLGAYLASIIAEDLTSMSSDAGMDYFFFLLGLFAGPVLWVAVVTIVLPAAWSVLVTSQNLRARALLRHVPLRTRNELPLATRMWVDDSRDDSMPSLGGQLERWIRTLSSNNAAQICAMMALAFAACGLAVVAQLLG